MNKRYITILCTECGLPEENRFCTAKRCTNCQKKRRSELSTKRSAEPKNKARIDAWFLMKRYGITREDELAILTKQDFKCPLCEESIAPGQKRTHIDHDHKTNKVRGILCFRCNVGLGSFCDNIPSLERAILYLRENNGTN